MLSLVSIVVPIYNTSEYLEKCVNSLINQSYRNLQIILIDDGSTDQSGEICDRYAKAYQYVETYHLKNGGVSRARNEGLKKAVGEYIFFVDSDDYVSSDYIEGFMKGNEDYVVSGYTETYNSDHTDQEIVLLETQYDLYEAKRELSNINTNIRYLSVWGVRYKREIIEKNNILFDESIKVGEDARYNLLYLNECEKIKTIPTCGYYYYIRDNSAMGKYEEDRLENIKEQCELLESFVIDDGLFFRVKKYYWYMAFEHYKKHKTRKNLDSKIINKRLNDCYKDSYFNQVKNAIYKNGTLDEKIEMLLMGRRRRYLYPLIIKMLENIVKFKKHIIR